MLSRNKISDIKKLVQKKFREETHLFIVEGTKSVMDLLHSQIAVKEVFATEQWIETHSENIPKSISVVPVTENDLDRITCLKTAQEVLAVAQMPDYSIRQIDFQKPILALDGIRDPGNLGTIIRTADWFGIKQIVCSNDCVDFMNPKVIQATMGSFSRMSIFYTDLSQFLNQKNIQGTVYGTFMQGTDISQVNFQNNDVIVMGNEANGISDEVSHCIQQKIHIPAFSLSSPKAESLNASIATAIVLYQFCNHILLNNNE